MKDRKDENEITKKIFDLILLYVLLHHGASVGTQDHTTKDTSASSREESPNRDRQTFTGKRSKTRVFFYF